MEHNLHNDNQKRTKKISNKFKQTKPKILLYADSMGRGLTAKLYDEHLSGEYMGFVKPDASFKEVVSTVKKDTKNLAQKDTVVLMAGEIDVARNNTSAAISGLKETLASLTHTNVVVVNIPHIHDLREWSCVNNEVKKANALTGFVIILRMSKL